MASEEELQAQVTDLTAKLAAMEPVKTERDSLSSEIGTLRDTISTHNSAVEALQAKLTAAEEIANTNTDAAEKLASLQEAHTALETRYSDGIRSRLKSHGLAESIFENKSLAELEAMDVALSNVTIKAPESGNAPGDPNKAGVTGGDGSGSRTVDSSLQAELDIIERARNRGR